MSNWGRHRIVELRQTQACRTEAEAGLSNRDRLTCRTEADTGLSNWDRHRLVELRLKQACRTETDWPVELRQAHDCRTEADSSLSNWGRHRLIEPRQAPACRTEADSSLSNWSRLKLVELKQTQANRTEAGTGLSNWGRNRLVELRQTQICRSEESALKTDSNFPSNLSRDFGSVYPSLATSVSVLLSWQGRNLQSRHVIHSYLFFQRVLKLASSRCLPGNHSEFTHLSVYVSTSRLTSRINFAEST
jgi:hypothetical protein